VIMRTLRSAIVGSGLAILLCAGCVVGPNYRRPTAAMPALFKELPTPADVATATWQPAQPGEDRIRAPWWEAFDDPLLTSLEERARSSNQTVAQADATFRAARAAIRAARADFFPTVSIGASASRARPSGGVVSGSAPGATNDFQLPFDFSYEADVWGRVRRSVEASVTSAQASSADVQTALLSVSSELAVDYFELRGLDAQRDLLTRTIAAYERALQLTTDRFNQGVASGIDVAQAQTQLETTRTQATDLGVARAQFEHAIATLAGEAPADLTIPPAVTDTVPPVIPVTMPSQLVERRPDVAAAERRAASANALIGVAKSAYFPTLSLTGSAGVQSSRLGALLSLPSRFWSIGPSLVETVFDGGRRRALTDEAIASYEEAVAAYRQSVLTAFQDVEDSLAALRVLAEEAGQADAAVTAANRSLALANQQYVAGLTSYLQVITAQTAALAAQLTAVDVRTRRMTASVLLVKALGGGWSAAELPAAHTLQRRVGSSPGAETGEKEPR